jgi:DNA repair exonuclease SbcCD ATPase subunit
LVIDAMFAKRSNKLSGQEPPSDDGSQTEQSGSHSRASLIERLELELEEQRAAGDSARAALDAATFKIETLEKSYAKQLSEVRERCAAAEAELEEKLQMLSNVGDGHEYTLRALYDALNVIKELKADRDQLRKDLAQARHARKAPPPRGRPGTDIGGETINALLSNTTWAVQKPRINAGPSAAPAAEQEAPREDMLAPDQVFTAEDKEDER